MLKIRLARGWKHKTPFYRVVLTESTKPVKCWYKDVLWWHDPINHKTEINIEKTKKLINNGAQLSDRVGKLLFKLSWDDYFKKFYTETIRTRKPRKESDEEETTTPKTPTTEETPTNNESSSTEETSSTE